MNTPRPSLTRLPAERTPAAAQIRPSGLGLLWSVGAVLGLIWTGLAALAAAIASWAGDWLQSPVIGAPATLPDVPAWLSDWVPTDAWASTAESLQAAWQSALAWLPALSTVTGWLEVLVWVAWAAGLAVLLLIVGGLHAWLAREARSAVLRP